jgi:branched-chain amino acid transport system substrate-binding protein
MRKKRMKTIFISDDGVKDDTFIKVAKKYAEGVYATGPKDVSSNPMAIAANEAHKKAYGADPGAFFLNAYAAALALLNAVEQAGSTEYDAVAKALRTKDVATPWEASILTGAVMPPALVSQCTRYKTASMLNLSN